MHEFKIFLGIQGTCVKDCCSHGPMGGITSKWTCYHFAHSWQVKYLIILIEVDILYKFSNVVWQKCLQNLLVC